VFTPAALEALRLLTWPGNVRELRNLLLRLRLEGSGPITPAAMERALAGVKTATIFPRNLLVGSSLGKLRRSLERDYIVCHFRRLDGDTASLCSFLGLSSRQLYRRCVRLGIRLRQERRSLGSRTAHGEKR
jgi:DNA-binding NtrC family response regulator